MGFGDWMKPVCFINVCIHSKWRLFVNSVTRTTGCHYKKAGRHIVRPLPILVIPSDVAFNPEHGRYLILFSSRHCGVVIVDLSSNVTSNCKEFQSSSSVLSFMCSFSFSRPKCHCAISIINCSSDNIINSRQLR